MYNQIEAEKKERRKIIAVATVAVAIILILIAAIVVVATKKTARDTAKTTETETAQVNENNSSTENKDKDETKSEAESESGDVAKNEAVDEETEGDNPMMSEEATTETTNTVATTDSSMPSTGPEDFLPIALMAGMLVTCLGSRKLAKKEA